MQKSKMFDIGANLTHESFADDLAQVLERASVAGIGAVSITAASLDDSIKAVELIESTNSKIDLSTTVGFHPHYSSEYNRCHYQQMKTHSDDLLVCAIGETGLDYYRDLSPRGQQKASFEDHIELAVETSMPMFLHQRQAHDDFFAMLSSYRHLLTKLVVHCFTGDKKMLHSYLDIDCYIGITGWICDDRRGSHLRELVADIPANRLLIETDSPYLIPPPLKKDFGRRNEPISLATVLATIAEYRRESVDLLKDLTFTNAQSFFSANKLS